MSFGVSLAFLGHLFVPFGVPLDSLWLPLGCSWDPFSAPWAPLGWLGALLGSLWLPWGLFGLPFGPWEPHRKPMALKYRACAQKLTRWNLHTDPGGPAGPAGPGETVHELQFRPPVPHAPGVRMT